MEVQTQNNKLKTALDVLRKSYDDNPYSSFNERKLILQVLKDSLILNEQNFYQALTEDYGHRSEFDTFIADVLPCVMSINYTLKRLKRWMKPSRRHAGIILSPSRVEVQYQPLGVVGVISPWNFPLFLSLVPAIQAIAAGNRVMIKLSEFTPRTNKILIEATECVREHIVIIEGEHEVGAEFSGLPFDHLVFTGSTTVGTYVAQAAAENLTPITLELGGKSPVIFAEDANLETAIDSVILGKTFNSGQVCVAPDYLFIPKSKKERFIALFKARYSDYFASSKKEDTPTYIVNQKQYNRLEGMLEDARNKGAEVHEIQGLNDDSETRLFNMHLVTKVDSSMLLMNEEIFGPILPIILYDSMDECIDYINERNRPLGLYIMSSNDVLIHKILKHTHSGGVCINDTCLQAIAEDAPFGGVGKSGIGHYHGKEGFLQLSKAKTVVHSKAWLPKNRIFLRQRSLVFKLLRLFLLR